MLKFDNVTLKYGSFRALDSISLHANAGELVVLLGANGAGKTSIFMAASGIHKPAEGRIDLNGQDIVGRRTAQIVQAGLVHCPEGRKLFPMMTVEKNLRLGAYVYRSDKAGIERSLQEVYELFPILAKKRGDPAGSLSGGQQQMVAIGRALLGRPKALLLDEPSLGLAPLVVKQVFEVIQRVNKAGTTVLLAEQNAYAALAIADRAYVIERGRLALEGDRESLLNNEAGRAASIGA
jgi:branched-chain amino acid transport system ATP-binding protein